MVLSSSWMHPKISFTFGIGNVMDTGPCNEIRLTCGRNFGCSFRTFSPLLNREDREKVRTGRQVGEALVSVKQMKRILFISYAIEYLSYVTEQSSLLT